MAKKQTLAAAIESTGTEALAPEPTKTPPAIACEIDLPSMGLTFTFGDGEQLIVTSGMFDAAILAQATLHGLKQKLGDAAAISRNPDTGRSATLADKKAAVREVFDRLCAGQWNKVREGGKGDGGRNLLLTALGNLYPARSATELAAWVEGMDEAQTKAIMGNPRVAAEIAAIRVKRAGADKIDSDALLAGLSS